MSSSEELSQYEEKSAKTFKSLNHTAGDSVIPRDMYGLYGVHVSNLPDDISEKVLNKTFSAVGRVAVCKIMEPKPRRACQPEPFIYAFVKFTSSKEAHSALSKFDGYELNGSSLAVRPAYVSEKPRKHPSPSAKQHHNDKSSDKSSEEDSSSSNARKQEESQRTKYVMSSSDCRLKDGRLHDSDVMLYNGTSNKTSPPKKVNGGRELAPRFRKDSPSLSSGSITSHDSRNFQGVPPTRVSEAPPAPTVPRQNETIHQQPTISGFQTSSYNVHNNVDSSMSASSSAFKRCQGTPSTSNQEAGMQKPGSMGDGVATVTSTFSRLGLSSPTRSFVENNNAPTWNHSQGSDIQLWRQGGTQGVTSWSQTGGTGLMLWSNGREKPITSPDRNQTAPEWSPQARPSVSFWSTGDVVQFFLNSDCAEYAGFFQEQEIDGRALLLLNRDTLLHFMKVGPALKVLQVIDELKAGVPPPVTGSNGW